MQRLFYAVVGLMLALPLSTMVSFAEMAEQPLTLKEASSLALSADPWLSGSVYREQALSDEAVAVGTLPDPKINLAAANFPTDSFDINQEPMTQLLVGVTQMFPRGDTRALSGKQKLQLAAQEPLLRLDRQAAARARVEQFWLSAYEAQETIRLIDGERTLFDQLVDAARARYVSAVGHTQQQDLIRAQVELTRLDDRLTRLVQQRQQAQRRLSEWIGVRALAALAVDLPDNAMHLSESQLLLLASDAQASFEAIAAHPQLQVIDQRIAALGTSVAIAEQKYAPEWGLTAQYGYRDDDQLGRDRADLFSIGVSFDVPMFTTNRQDKEVSAASARVAALKTGKQLKIRTLVADFQEAAVSLTRLNERAVLFDITLLPQMSAQSDSSLAAYNNDNGNFSDAVTARIAELNAKIERLGIAVAQQKSASKINYLLAGSGQLNIAAEAL